MVLIGAIKHGLDGLTALGIGGVAVEATYQFVPFATLSFFVTSRVIGYVLNAYVSQEINSDDK